jgi:hypothetical protein
VTLPKGNQPNRRSAYPPKKQTARPKDGHRQRLPAAAHYEFSEAAHCSLLLVRIRVRQQRQITGALYRSRQLTLILGFGTRNAAGYDFACLGNVLLQCLEILVINLLDPFGSKLAKLSASKET